MDARGKTPLVLAEGAAMPKSCSSKPRPKTVPLKEQAAASFLFRVHSADGVHAELLANGLKLEPPQVAFYGMKQLYFKDPDGYELCFQNRVERTTPSQP